MAESGPESGAVDLTLKLPDELITKILLLVPATYRVAKCWAEGGCLVCWRWRMLLQTPTVKLKLLVGWETAIQTHALVAFWSRLADAPPIPRHRARTQLRFTSTGEDLMRGVGDFEAETGCQIPASLLEMWREVDGQSIGLVWLFGFHGLDDALDIRELEERVEDRCETEEDGGVFDEMPGYDFSRDLAVKFGVQGSGADGYTCFYMVCDPASVHHGGVYLKHADGACRFAADTLAEFLSKWVALAEGVAMEGEYLDELSDACYGF
jgi:hypothetical protein